MCGRHADSSCLLSFHRPYRDNAGRLVCDEKPNSKEGEVVQG